MVSNLQKQLKLIRNPEFVKGTGKGIKKGKQIPSVLFTKENAARNDLAAVYEIGSNGFHELLSLDARFLEFEESLFGQDNLERDRVLMDKAWNEKLNIILARFLKLLSKYFLMRPASMVLEWLVRRFRINEFNVEEVLTCILPFYETNNFLLVLRTLFFESYPRWQFLVLVRKSEKPMTRSYFVRQLHSDLSLLRFICEFTQQYIDQGVSYTTLLNFYITTLIEFLDPNVRVDSNALNILLPSILHGLCSANTEYKLCTYLILSQLGNCVHFSANALSKILFSILSNAQSEWKHLIFNLLSLAQSQSHFPEAIMECDLSVLLLETPFNCLIDLCKEFNGDVLLKSILLHFTEKRNIDAMTMFLSSLELELSTSILESVFFSLLTLVEKEEQIENITTLFSQLHGRYGSILEVVASNFISKRNDIHVFKLIQQCLGTTSHAIVQDTGTSILLSLQHTNPEFNVAGVKQLLSVLSNTTSSSSSSSTTPPMLDEDAKALASATVTCLKGSSELRNYILESNILLEFMFHNACEASLEMLLSLGSEHPSPILIRACSFALTFLSKHASSHGLVSKLEILLLHFSILHKEWFESLEITLPELGAARIHEFLGNTNYAQSGLTLVTESNFNVFMKDVLTLFNHPQETIRVQAIEKALALTQATELPQLMEHLVSLSDKEFNTYFHSTSTRFASSFEFLTFCAHQLQSESSKVVLRCLSCIRNIICSEPKDYQTLIVFLMPCFLNPEKSVRLETKSILLEILHVLKSFDLESPHKFDWPEPLPSLGYEMTHIQLAKPKYLAKWLEDVLIIDFSSSEENVAHVPYHKKFENILIAFLSHVPRLSLKVQLHWLELLKHHTLPFIITLLHKHYQTLFLQLSSKPDRTTMLVLQAFVSVMKPSMAYDLFRVPNVFDTFKHFLSRYDSSDFEKLQYLCLKFVQKSSWLALNVEQQYELFNLLLTIVSKSKSSENVLEAKAALTRIPLAEDLVGRFLTTFIALKQSDDPDFELEQPKKRQRMNTRSKQMSKLIALLELLKYKPFEAYEVLVPSLFQALDLVLQHKPTSSSSNEAASSHQHDFITQLILSDLLLADMSSLHDTVFRVELLVACLRSSDNPQTHNTALLVLSRIAPLCPDKVLLNLMPIFTFMGAHVSKQDDEFSFNTIESTIYSTVSALTLDVAHILLVVQVFVDTVLHIPVHRRLRLFSTLVKTIGPRQLFLVVLLLLEKNVPELFEFAVLLHTEFSIAFQLRSLCKLISLINLQKTQIASSTTTPCKVTPFLPSTVMNSPPLTDGSDVETTAPVSQVTKKEKSVSMKHPAKLNLPTSAFIHVIDPVMVSNLKPVILQFVSENLSLKSFTNNYSKSGVDPNAKMLIKELLEFVQLFSTEKTMLPNAYASLNKIQTLLPVAEFVTIMSELWQHESLEIVKKSLRLFHERLLQLNPNSMTKNKFALLDSVPVICQVLQTKSHDTEIASLCLALLQQLCSQYGSQNPAPFTVSVQCILPFFEHFESRRSEVIASAYACFAHYIHALKQRLVQYFNSAMKSSFTFFQAIHNNPIHRLSVYLFWEHSLSYLHAFISPFLSTLLKYLLEYPMPKNKLVTEKIDAIAKVLGEKVEPRILLPFLFVYILEHSKEQTPISDSAFTLLINIMSPLIQRMTKQDVIQYHDSIFNRFFLAAFSSFSFTVESESFISSCFVPFIMRLNEGLFRPLFRSFLAWVEKDQPHRLLVLFKVCEALFPHLRHLFVSYYLTTLDLLLTSLQSSTLPSSIRSSALSSFILACQFDTEKSLTSFTSKLVPALGHCFESHAEASEQAMVQLALTVNKDTEWKEILTYLLDLLQYSSSSTASSIPKRMTALRCLGQCFEKIGEPFLVFLPETLPALAECLETEELESVTSRVVRQMEEVVGEPLQSYLQK